MQHKMNTLQTVVMVVKNIAGMSLVTCIGMLRMNYVKVIAVVAITSALYIIS
jgi:hypothetical protein